jgi:hypothetical protein
MIAIKKHSDKIGRPAGALVGQAVEDSEDDRSQRLEDKAKSAGAYEPLGNVL